jgi:regulator of sigma E protease
MEMQVTSISTGQTILAFLFVLTVVVFFHELGHFLVARWCGVKVRTFSIGFGPEIFGFNDKKGTRWRFAWIPLGGYVKFLDDENVASAPDHGAIAAMTEEERAGSFHYKPLYQRAAIVAAGPIANFILAILIYAVLFTAVGQTTISPRVDQVVEGSAAESAGFKNGDLVVEIDGEAIESFGEMQRIVGLSAGEQLTVVVMRDGARVELTPTPERKEKQDFFGNTVRMGVLGISRSNAPEDRTFERHDPFTALWLGTKETYTIARHTLVYIGRVFSGRESADQLGGPLRIAQVSGQVASLGFVALIGLTAVLSVSIGLLNLFPIPILDGGHLLFYAIEAVRGRPLSPRSQEIGLRIGLALILMLMIFVTWNDLIQFELL